MTPYKTGGAIMSKRILSTAVLMFAALTPIEGRADIIDVSDVEVTAFGSFSTQLQPTKTASDNKVAPLGDSTRAEVLVLAGGGLAIPFPNKPTSQTQAFASSAADATGFSASE
jgi:hypothetical protein